MSACTLTTDLWQSELRFVAAMQELVFGRFESLRISRGELILEPWPRSVRNMKFGTAQIAVLDGRPAEFELKKQVVEFFEYVRAVDSGGICCLEIKHGLPFSMEIEHRSDDFGESSRCLK